MFFFFFKGSHRSPFILRGTQNGHFAPVLPVFISHVHFLL
uniref:Uncharacterized protein n=1 Tax=Anguilla anguilla TaxID=7936 RepID=A0A0E9SHP8_ANGAN